MFDYAREKEKLDRQLSGNLISQHQYDKDIKYLNQAYQKIEENKAQFAAQQIDGLAYNKREAEIVKEYDTKVSERQVNLAKAKMKRRNLLGFLGFIVCAIAAIAVIFAVTNGYKHRSIAGIPEPIQGEAIGNITLTRDYNTLELTYTHSYTIDGIIIYKEIDNGTSAYSSSIPYVFGMAWGYAAEHNSEISWSYNNRNLLAKNYGGLDRLSIEKTYSVNEIIPADDTVERDLVRYGQGDRIKITGCLVKAHVYNAAEEYTVLSSEVRGDITNFIAGGPTANEIIYATSVVKIEDQ